MKSSFDSESSSGSDLSVDYLTNKRCVSTSPSVGTSDEGIGGEWIATRFTEPPVYCAENRGTVDLDPLAINAPVVDLTTVNPSDEESQEEMLTIAPNTTSQVDSPPTSMEELLQQLIAFGHMDVPALIREEQERASEGDINLDVPSDGPTFAAQMILWKRFKSIFQSSKIRLRLIPNENYAFTIVASPSPTAVDANDASTFEDFSIDVTSLHQYDSLPFPLPSVIQELLNPNDELTSPNSRSAYFALLLCDGFKWVLIGVFLENIAALDENVGLPDVKMVQSVTEVDTIRDYEDEAEVATFDPPRLSIGTEPVVNTPVIDEGSTEIALEQQFSKKIKEMNDSLLEIKAELADHRLRTSITPRNSVARVLPFASQFLSSRPSPLFRFKVQVQEELCMPLIVFNEFDHIPL